MNFSKVVPSQSLFKDLKALKEGTNVPKRKCLEELLLQNEMDRRLNLTFTKSNTPKVIQNSRNGDLSINRIQNPTENKSPFKIGFQSYQTSRKSSLAQITS